MQNIVGYRAWLPCAVRKRLRCGSAYSVGGTPSLPDETSAQPMTRPARLTPPGVESAGKEDLGKV